LAGTFTKNLFLRDKKKRLFLLSVHEDTTVDLTTLHHAIGAQGRLGFASPELMSGLLGVSPGTVTPLALMNDAANRVTFVIEETLLSAEQLNFHPMTQTESIGLTPDQLTRFLAQCDHTPVPVKIA
jgi:Ala-tRNA(Pro) deacylase